MTAKESAIWTVKSVSSTDRAVYSCVFSYISELEGHEENTIYRAYKGFDTFRLLEVFLCHNLLQCSNLNKYSTKTCYVIAILSCVIGLEWILLTQECNR